MTGAKPVYLAAIGIKVTGRDGMPLTIAPGAPIDDFESWPYDNQLSLLRLGHVKLVGGRHTANLSVDGGYVHYEAPPPVPAHDPVVPVATADEPETSIVDYDAVPADFGEPEALRKPAPVKGPAICPDCQKACNGVRGLALHRAKAHGGSA